MNVYRDHDFRKIIYENVNLRNHSQFTQDNVIS